MRFLLTPKWIVGHLLITALAVTFMLLGFWQLDRLQQRREANAVSQARIEAEPVPLPEMLAASGGDTTSLEYRRATVTGVFDPSQEVLLRSQVRDTRAGFDVITPLRIEGGHAVLVDRGWVPLEFDDVPVVAALPPKGEITIQGIVRLGQTRTGSGHDDFANGAAVTISRVDIGGLATQIDGELAPVYLQVLGEVGPTVLPVPADPPDFQDEGPHRDYAIQWFAFTLIAVVGHGLLIRRAISRRS